MRQTFTIGRFSGIPVVVHVSWIVAYAFIAGSLAQLLDGVPRGVAVGLGALGGLLLFASLIAHEFAHAFVARRFGIGTHRITLFLLGGVALLEREPPSPRAEALVALAGPAFSAALAALAFGAFTLLQRFGSGALEGTLELLAAYASFANAALAVFNLIPAFPMDGGRVLRAVIWQLRGSQAAATGAASIVGLLFAAALILGGAAGVLITHDMSQAWYGLIGIFLLRQGWQQLQVSRATERLERTRALLDRAA